MNSTPAQLQQFFTSHYFFGGLRQAVGVLLPGLFMAGVYGEVSTAFVAAVGAVCVAILDQPGGPRRYGLNGMIAALCLGSLTTAITGLAASYALAIWLIVPCLCFAFSMLTVYGRHGGLLGFACLLIMTLTLRIPLTPGDVMQHTLTSFLGGAFYLAYSTLAHRILWHREEQQVLAAALFATADYIATRARFYDVRVDLRDSYRQLIRNQARMTDAHQMARDMVLRELPRGDSSRADRLRQGLLNLFVDMVGLLDSLVATHTDYATLRKALPDSDSLLFIRDAMNKLAGNITGLAQNLARNHRGLVRNSVKAELQALEYELQHLRERDLPASDPELYALLVQVLRRLRNITRRVDRMAQHSYDPIAPDADRQRVNRSLNRFLTRQKWRPELLTHNLNLQSAHFRYALRVAAAALLAMVIGTLMARAPLVRTLDPGLIAHSYWIILTVLIIMKPGFALTRQRNGWRVTGTLLGCALALVLFATVENHAVYLLLIVICYTLGFALIQVNYTLSALFNTLVVLLVFHFLIPGSTAVVGERMADTLIGSILALGCSHILPSWERSNLDALARALNEANQNFLALGRAWVELARRARTDPAPAPGECEEAELQWQIARKNVHLAFSNFASAFYRMMDEPRRRQRHVREFNQILTQSHVLASQIGAIMPHLAQLDEDPPRIHQALQATQDLLAQRAGDVPRTLETEGDYAALAYPLRQMMKAAQRIAEDLRTLAA